MKPVTAALLLAQLVSAGCTAQPNKRGGVPDGTLYLGVPEGIHRLDTRKGSLDLLASSVALMYPPSAFIGDTLVVCLKGKDWKNVVGLLNTETRAARMVSHGIAPCGWPSHRAVVSVDISGPDSAYLVIREVLGTTVTRGRRLIGPLSGLLQVFPAPVYVSETDEILVSVDDELFLLDWKGDRRRLGIRGYSPLAYDPFRSVVILRDRRHADRIGVYELKTGALKVTTVWSRVLGCVPTRGGYFVSNLRPGMGLGEHWDLWWCNERLQKVVLVGQQVMAYG